MTPRRIANSWPSENPKMVQSSTLSTALVTKLGSILRMLGPMVSVSFSNWTVPPFMIDSRSSSMAFGLVRPLKPSISGTRAIILELICFLLVIVRRAHFQNLPPASPRRVSLQSLRGFLLFTILLFPSFWEKSNQARIQNVNWELNNYLETNAAALIALGSK